MSKAADRERRAEQSWLARTPIPRHAVVISHGPCLDGAASGVCVARWYGRTNVTPYFTHPSEIDALIRGLNLEHRPPSDIWITDIAWKDEETEQLFPRLAQHGSRVFWVDHHANALARAARGLGGLCLAGHKISNEYSAAKLTYDFLLDVRPVRGDLSALRDFEKVVLMADDTDRWVHRLPGSRELALAVGAMTSMAVYEELLQIDADGTYTPALRKALEQSQFELKTSIALAVATRTRRRIGGVTVVGCMCAGYVSEVAEYLRQDESTALFVMYNVQNRRISLRRSDDAPVDCAALAGKFSGGGHPAAAGFDLPSLDALIVSVMTERTAEALSTLLQEARRTSSS